LKQLEVALITVEIAQSLKFQWENVGNHIDASWTTIISLGLTLKANNIHLEINLFLKSTRKIFQPVARKENCGNTI
jgi:hypothetical protein